MEDFVKAGQTVSAAGMTKFLGGKGFNQSIAIAKSGVPIYHAGCIEHDGEHLRQALRAHSVDTDFVNTVETPTGHAIIQVNNRGENCIIIYPGANFCVTEEFADRVLSHFDCGDILLLQNEINNLEYIVSDGCRKGMKIVLNPSPLNDTLKTIDFNKLYAIVLNEVECLDLTEKSIPQDICGCFKEHYHQFKVVLTLGQKGCIYFDCATGAEYACPAFQIAVKDTTAAGDTSMGYYIHGLYHGLCTEETLRLASAASALAVSAEGSSASIPKIAEVKEALRHLKPYAQKAGRPELKEVILDYINNHLKDASLKELAVLLQYSVTHTSAKVRSCTGLSFSVLVQKARCEYAAGLLRETDLPIDSIIMQVGYENSSFFRRIFNSEFGKSPLAYRKEYRKWEKNNS